MSVGVVSVTVKRSQSQIYQLTLAPHELPPAGGAGQHSPGKVPQTAARAGRGWGASRHRRVAGQQAARQKPWRGLQGTRSRWRARHMCMRKHSFPITLFIYEAEQVTIEVVWLFIIINLFDYSLIWRVYGFVVVFVSFLSFSSWHLNETARKSCFKNSKDTFK